MDLHLDLDGASGRTLRARAENALRDAVREGRLSPGTRLPATRALATELGVSRGVIVDAYAQLAAEGYLDTRRGGGTRVAAMEGATPAGDAAAGDGEETAASPHGGGPAPIRFDLSPSLPSVDGFPRKAWLAALTRVLRTVPDARLAYGDRQGEPELRTAIAGWLARRRGVRATAEQVVISGGLRDALPLVWRLLAENGAHRVAVEDPGWWRVARSVEVAGLTPVPTPVDADGLDPDRLPQQGIDAVAITPAHQFPTGAVLSPARRAALVAYARRHHACLVEDDYDAEFRYDRQPVGSVQGLAPDLTIYGGSVSKTLAPALRLGWLVLPSTLTAFLHDDDPAAPAGTPPTLDQLTLADLIDRGEVDRHLRRQRLRYRARRDALLRELARQLPNHPIHGAAAGLFAVLTLPPGADEDAIVSRAADHGLAVDALRAPGRAGLVLGYANLPEPAAPVAVRALTHVLG